MGREDFGAVTEASEGNWGRRKEVPWGLLPTSPSTDLVNET